MRLCAPLEFGLTVRADDELVRPPVCLQLLRLPDVTACYVACVLYWSCIMSWEFTTGHLPSVLDSCVPLGVQAGP